MKKKCNPLFMINYLKIQNLVCTALHYGYTLPIAFLHSPPVSVILQVALNY